MKPFGSSEAQPIQEALMDAANYIEEGMHPNEALTKVAKEYNIPVGHIPVMAKIYNISRFENQRKEASDLFGKLQEFDLADADVILQNLYPQEVKSAGQVSKEIVVSDDYDFLPAKKEYKKSASDLATKFDALFANSEQDVKLQESKNNSLNASKHTVLYKEALAKADRLDWQYDELFEKTSEVADKVRIYTRELADWFKNAVTKSSYNYHEVVKNADVMFGEAGGNILRALAKHDELLNKTAKLQEQEPFFYRSASEHEKPYNLIKKCLENIEKFAEAKKELDSFEANLAKSKEELLGPFVSKKAEKVPIGEETFPKGQAISSILGIQEQSTSGASAEVKAGTFTGILAGVTGTTLGRELANRIPGAPSTDKLKEKALTSLTDPAHEQSLRNIHTEALLSDLLSNDDVISGYDPEEVVQNFNEITQIAPRAATQQGIIRALLRKRLQQGSLDPYEIEALLRVETGLKRRDTPVGGAALFAGGRDE